MSQRPGRRPSTPPLAIPIQDALMLRLIADFRTFQLGIGGWHSATMNSMDQRETDNRLVMGNW